ncbi:DUF192 domain-containing protein [Roseivivax isoporae]|uniref:Uncharacterized protein n=1 Tax=Roseivivax isoporae LMG 25204 TaxID=1449351 RepID=X7F5G2_9RHOB|nr:DUF192 domain-containing protein [Roseivivax isoporae]ETX27319.1 hypothetical protein RISW2_14580 [Roseivivax isoporae LMG 25204]
MGNRRHAQALAAALMIAPGVAGAACAPDALSLRGDFGTARFAVDVADTPEERARGLMFVEEMPRFTGMLFVYERPQPVSFWMKNTLIPLDIIFADASGTVQRVHPDAVPGDLTAIPGGDGIQYVLEVNGGMSESLGIAPGVELQHPAIPGEAAAWPCEDAAAG